MPLKITHVSSKVKAYEPKTNEEGIRHAINLTDEVRDEAIVKIMEHQKWDFFYYNLRV